MLHTKQPMKLEKRRHTLHDLGFRPSQVASAALLLACSILVYPISYSGNITFAAIIDDASTYNIRSQDQTYTGQPRRNEVTSGDLDQDGLRWLLAAAEAYLANNARGDCVLLQQGEALIGQLR
ncbi:hypothetical protein Vafri_9984, partial [Volvox africanus]